MASTKPTAQQPNLASGSRGEARAAAGQGEALQEPVLEPAAAGQGEAQQEPFAEPAAPGTEAVKGEGEMEEGECGFCLFMKAGGCKDAFTAWMDCVEASEKEGGDMVERCAQTTINLKTCMDAHADYYAPVLQAEQAISDQAEAAVAAAEAEKDKGGELPAASTPSSAEDNKEGTASSPAAAGEGK